MNEVILNDLLSLSHFLGEPSRGWAILGEGNTSAKIDAETFTIKASGSQLGTLSIDQLARVRFPPILEALTSEADFSDEQVKDLMLSARVSDQDKLPSIETLMHAYLLTLPGIAYIGHTHVTSINGLLCSVRGWEAMTGGRRLFPDEIVVCGIAPCCVPYVDPGVPLARVLKTQVTAYVETHGTPPKTIYLQNHGFIAVGRSAREVQSITLMAEKAAQILAAALAIGEPSYLSDANVQRIYTWPAEHFRQKALGLSQDADADQGKR